MTSTLTRPEGPVPLFSSPAPPPPRRRLTHTLSLFVVDAVLAVVFLLVIDVPLTGVAVHEWLGIAIAIGAGVHLVQHASWVVSTGRRLFARCSARNRLNFLLMVGLFLGFASIVASGLLISESALPALGVAPPGTDFWRWLHLASVGWVLWLMAIHLVWHGDWVLKTTRRYLIEPLRHSREVRS